MRLPIFFVFEGDSIIYSFPIMSISESFPYILSFCFIFMGFFYTQMCVSLHLYVFLVLLLWLFLFLFLFFGIFWLIWFFFVLFYYYSLDVCFLFLVINRKAMDLGRSRSEVEVRGVQIEKIIKENILWKECIFNKKIRKKLVKKF